MEKTKRTQSAQGYDSLVTKPVRKSNSVPRNEDFLVLGGRGGKKVYIPSFKVPDTPLGTRSVVSSVVAQRQPSGKLPVSLPEFTLENTANLTEEEFVELLCLNGKFDPIKLAIILCLPDGDRIAIQVIEHISKSRLLEVLGGNRDSAEGLGDLLSGKNPLKRITSELLTTEELGEYLRVVFRYPLMALQNKEVYGPIIALAQVMLDTCPNKGRRREFESQLRKIIDLILGKLPPPNEENQRYWDNIIKTIKRRIRGKKGKEKVTAKLVKFKKKFPVLKLVFS
ncbi:MAG: hypothetical protein LBD34_01805 [Puniceicoccales bacterium]|jgi:hypothetical protein|nr:hypothetical protein [Puniceicoccales bacterium]